MAHLLLHAIIPLIVLLLVSLLLMSRVSPKLLQALALSLTDGNRLGLWFLAAGLGFALYGASLALTTSLPVSIDAVEVSVTDVAQVTLRGQAMYTTLAAAERYSLLYGPMCYLPYSFALVVFGSSLMSLKLTLVLINVALFATLFAVFRKLLAWRLSLIVTGLLAASFLMLLDSTLLVRGDAPLCLGLALCLLAVELRNKAGVILLFSVAAALSLDIKFTAAVYLLIPLYMVLRRHGAAVAAGCIVMGGCVAALPFLLPNISIRNYLSWLHEAARHPLNHKLFAMNVVAAVILAIPPAVMIVRSGLFQRGNREAPERESKILLVLLLLSVCGSIVVGSKIGAGRSHLIPSFILAAYVSALLFKLPAVKPVKSILYPFVILTYVVLLFLPAVMQVHDLWYICYNRRAYAQQVNQDIQTIQQRYPASQLEMGYDSSQDANATVAPLALFKPQLVFAGGPLTMDAVGMFDMGLSGLKVPQTTLAMVSSCRPAVWIIPKGGTPFGMETPYVKIIPERFPDRSLFGTAFQNAFQASYHQVDSSRFYDIYACRTTGSR